MFIPTWLLVVGVVLLILALSRRAEVADFFQTLGCLAVGVGFCASVGLAIYFLIQEQYLAALVCGSPVIAWGLWESSKEARTVWLSGGSLNEPALRRMLKSHARKVSRLGDDPSRIAEARLAFAEQIGLGPTLWQLYEEIKYFPSWYQLENQGDWPGSQFVSASDLSAASAEEVAGLGLDVKRGRDNLLWWFERGESAKYLLIMRDVEVLSDYVPQPGDSQFLSGRRVHEIVIGEHPKAILLRARLTYKAGVDWDAFDALTVEAFRPRDWLLKLYRLTMDVKAEQDAWGKTVVNKYSSLDPDRARKNFMDR